MKLMLTVFLLAALMFSHSTFAQSTKKTTKPGFFVLHLNKVANENIEKANNILDSVSVPILKELVLEGKLLSWGQLDHAWGDEWNYNFYFITETQRTFFEFWDEYVSRINKRFPGWWKSVAQLFSAHKDNMYSIRQMQ
jgi:hypothetical protein